MFDINELDNQNWSKAQDSFGKSENIYLTDSKVIKVTYDKEVDISGTEKKVWKNVYKELFKEYKPNSQTQTVDFSKNINNIRFRCHMFHQLSEGWTIALRALPNKLGKWKDLGIVKEDIMSISSKNGLIVISGPTGAGKSTTMSKVIHTLDKAKLLGVAVSIENPVEFVYDSPLIFQREVGIDVKSFESGIYEAMRQTPKTIIIGEIRGSETALAAVKAGLSGHRIIATIHANSIEDAVSRFWMFLDKDKGLLIHALQGIFAQHLLDIPERDKPLLVYESLEINHSAKMVLESILDPKTSSSLKLLSHEQYQQKRKSLLEIKNELFSQGLDYNYIKF